MPLDPRVLANDPERRSVVLRVLDAAVAAVGPEVAVRHHLTRMQGMLWIGGHEVPEPRGKVILLALGKAAVPMARTAVDVLRGLPITGAAAAPTAAGVAGVKVLVGGHPLPDDGSLRAGRALLDLAESAGSDDLVLVLISGGGSALAEVPLPGLSLDDLQAVNRALLRSGAPITEVNTVRRHLSAVKGGGLGAAAAPARLASLIVSDVVGSPLEAIAGGPTVPDPTSAEEAIQVLADRGISPPPAVSRLLADQVAPLQAPRLPIGLVSLIADGSVAAHAAVDAAVGLGVAARVASTTLQGEARRVGAELAASARDLPPATMAIYAGETTVIVSGSGIGGRNQELALAAGIALDGYPDALVASFGTDGVDGPTDAAGGIGDSETVRRGLRLGFDARAALAQNDSATYLGATGDQLRCGPTGTNVGDIVIVHRSATP